MKNEVKKVDLLTEEESNIYNLTKEQALERLKEAGVSESEQMLVKWCRDQEIDAVRISKGAPATRGLRISEQSLEAFILAKAGNVLQLLKEIDSLKEKLAKKDEENKELKKQIKQMKEQGIVVEEKKGVKIDKFDLDSDGAGATFKYDRATYSVLFDTSNNGELIQISKKGRGRAISDVTELMNKNEGFIKAVNECRNNALVELDIMPGQLSIDEVDTTEKPE